MKKRQNINHGAWDAVTTGAVEINDRQHLKTRIERGDRLRVKLGLDPTRPDIHLGHTVVLRALRRYQEHGNTAVLIIGDRTARIRHSTSSSAATSKRPTPSRRRIFRRCHCWKGSMACRR